MNRYALMIFLLFSAGIATAGYIVDSSNSKPLGTDKVPIGRTKGGPSYSVVVDDIAEYSIKTGKSATFGSLSTNSINMPQGVDEQSIVLFEAAANGDNTVTISPFANMSSNKDVRIGNHGMYVNGIKVLSW